MEEKKIKKKKLTVTVSSKKTPNIPFYQLNKQKTSVVIEKKISQPLRFLFWFLFYFFTFYISSKLTLLIMKKRLIFLMILKILDFIKNIQK